MSGFAVPASQARQVTDSRRSLQGAAHYQTGLQYFRQQGIVPYTAIGNKIFIKEADVHRLLAANLITSKK